MTNAADATAAPVEFKAKDRTLMLYPLDIEDYGWLERSMQSAVIERARDSIKDRELSELDKRVIMSEAHKTAARLTFSDDGAQEVMECVDGLLKIAFLSLRKGDSNIKEKEVAKLFANGRELAEAVRKIMEISGASEAGAGNEVGQKKT